MTGNHYVIKYGAMDQLHSITHNRIEGWYGDLVTWSKKYGKLVEMDSFQGQTATSVKAYMQEVHGILLYSIQQALTAYEASFLLYKNGFYDLEGDKYATIPQEIINGISNQLQTESNQLTIISDSIQASLGSVSDIFSLPSPGKDTLHGEIDGLKQDLQEYTSNIESYESNQYMIANGDLRGLLDILQRTVQGYLDGSPNIASYQSGAIAGNANVLDLYNKVEQSSVYVASKQQEIEAAATRQSEIYAEMQAEYEAACEARKDKGASQIIMGGVAVFVGVLAIVGTAGMATPIVATAYVAGGCSIAYGISETVEGAQEHYYGSIGDISTKAINPIRDTVFMGNQSVYNAWGSLSMTVAGLCVPVGQAVNGVAGASTGVMVKTAAKTVVKESIKDTAYDTVSGAITDYATDKLGLNQTWSTIVNLGVSFGIDKSAEAIEGKLGFGPTLGEQMSMDEAKRYNEYWDSVKKGTHNNHPGLSEADIAAWDFADAKVNEHILVNQIDTNALLDLRAQELALQNSFQNGTVDVGGSASAESKPYANSRPSYGKNQIELVWENAKDPVTGKVYDPSGVEITWDPTKPRNGQWDMGHIPGEKYADMHKLYMDDIITKAEFLEWYRNPANYRPELPGTNRGHRYE